MAPSCVLLVDIADGAVLGAARQALQHLGAALCLRPAPAAGAAVLGMCNLAQPPQAAKPVLQVRCRPGPFALREFYAATARLATSGPGVSGALAAAALQQLVNFVARDPACGAAGSDRAVLYVSDKAGYEPDEFRTCLEVCRSKGVRVELVLLCAQQEAEAASAEGGSNAGDAGEVHSLSNAVSSSSRGSTLEALAAAWSAAEAAFPHLTVSLVPHASKLSLDQLAGTLLQRFAGQMHPMVNLQFKQPLVGSIRALQLSCQAEILPLAQSVRHAALCPCHRTPAAFVQGAAACCAITGAPLDSRQCGRDERTVQVGGIPGGALHLPAPFNIGTAGGGSGTAAALNVVARVKADQASPTLLFGMPLMLTTAPAAAAGQAAGEGQRFKVVHDGEMADVSTRQLLDLLCSSLSTSGEALLATCTIDLESGAAGLFRLHYLLLPCGAAGQPPSLCAKRVACAEELVPPLLAAAPEAPVGIAPLPPAVAEAVAGQLGRVPLEARLDSLSLSSRCCDTVEMLVRESLPLPKPQMPAAPAVAAPAPPVAPAAMAPAAVPMAPAAPPEAGAAEHQQPPAAGGRRQAGGGGGAGAGARASGGGRGKGGGGKGGSKGTLDFRRSTRR